MRRYCEIWFVAGREGRERPVRGIFHVSSGGEDSGPKFSSSVWGSISRSGRGGVSSGREFVRRRRSSRQIALFSC